MWLGGTPAADLPEGRARWSDTVVAENETESCLHCEINELVRERIEGEDNVDIADLVGRVAESLVDLILLAPEEEQGNALAAAIAHIGHSFLEKGGAIEGGTNTAH